MNVIDIAMRTNDGVRESIVSTKEVIDNLCREERKEEVLAVVRELGGYLINYADARKLTLDELLCVTYVLANSFTASADIYESLTEEDE